MVDQLEYIRPEELERWLDEKRDIAVIDARDDDCYGGIRSPLTVNLPSRETTDEHVTRYAKDLAAKQAIIFHCMLSQVRGPKMALRFLRHFEAIGASRRPQICVLRGGYQNFEAEMARRRPELLGKPES